METINAAELATWVPLTVHLEDETPSIEWGDFGERRFNEPFFEDTLLKWAKEEPSRRVVRTDLNAVVTLDQASSLDPDGVIFHCSRCGSTLLARLVRQVEGCVVVSEPPIINSVLTADPSIIDDDTRVQLLRLLLRALGRRRLGDETHYVVKLSSWNVLRCDLFRRAFPDASLLWLQRRAAEVMLSLLAHNPSWLNWREKPRLALAMFGILPAELPTIKPATFYARALAAIFRAALAQGAEIMPTIDYADLPEAAWTRVAPHFGLSPTAADIARMEADARFNAKDMEPRIFTPKLLGAVPDAIRNLVADEIDACYQALSERAAAAPDLLQSDGGRS